MAEVKAASVDLGITPIGPGENIKDKNIPNGGMVFEIESEEDDGPLEDPIEEKIFSIIYIPKLEPEPKTGYKQHWVLGRFIDYQMAERAFKRLKRECKSQLEISQTRGVKEFDVWNPERTINGTIMISTFISRKNILYRDRMDRFLQLTI